MTYCLLPTQPLSGAALAFRQRWTDRWDGYIPCRWGQAPAGSEYDHRHAYPEFRSPLSLEEEIQAGGEFHLEIVRRLMQGRLVTVVTFAYEWENEEGGRHLSSDPEARALDGERWFSFVEDPEDGAVLHLSLSTLSVDDPRLAAIFNSAANDGAEVLLFDPDLDWVARPNEGCMPVHTFTAPPLELLRQVEGECWDRWGIATERHPLLDLAAVSAFFESRREGWAEQGVRVVEGPQYRVWQGDRIEIERDLPADLSCVDWLLVSFEAATAGARVVVYDSGTCDVLLDPDNENPDSEIIRERRQHAGTLDTEGATTAVLERVVATLAELGSATTERS